MKKTLQFIVTLSLFLTTTVAICQNTSPADLDRLSEALHQSLEHESPAIVCRRGEPIKGSGPVLVESCFSGVNVIKVSIIPYDSKELAKSQFREFSALEKSKEATTDIGDEGYAWGFQKSKTAFNKDRYNVYVSIDGEMEDTDKFSKKFAKTIAKALKNL